MSGKVEHRKVVGIEYTLKNLAGEILDSNEGEEPLYFIQGLGNIVPGLEKALAEKSEGDRLEVLVKAAEGYGEYDKNLVRRVPRDKLKNFGNPKKGAMIRSQSPDGEQIFVITDVTATHVQLDGNHPMAGQDLYFDIRITEIREPTKDELEHGHVHGQDGHHHH